MKWSAMLDPVQDTSFKGITALIEKSVKSLQTMLKKINVQNRNS